METIFAIMINTWITLKYDICHRHGLFKKKIDTEICQKIQIKKDSAYISSTCINALNNMLNLRKAIFLN